MAAAWCLWSRENGLQGERVVCKVKNEDSLCVLECHQVEVVQWQVIVRCGGLWKLYRADRRVWVLREGNSNDGPNVGWSMLRGDSGRVCGI